MSSNIGKLDRYIYIIICLFAFTSCINNVIANNILAIGVLIGIIRCYKERLSIKIYKGYIQAILIFFGFIFISIFVSPDILKSSKEFWRYFNRMFAFLLILFFAREKKQILTVFFTFLLSMFINNLYAAYKGTFFIYNGVQNMRITGFENGIIIFAGHLLIMLPILFILIFNKQIKNKGYLKYILLAFIISFIALLENGTRIAWLAMGIILPLIFILKVQNLKKILFTGCISLLFVGIFVYMSPFLQTRLYSFIDYKNTSNQGHYMIARDSIELIKDNPIMGVGLGRYKEVFNEEYRSEEHFRLEDGFTPHAHNNTLTLWAETGIFGCMTFWYMYLSFLYYSFRRWLKEKNDSDLMFFMITLATVLQGITDYSFGLNQVVKIYFCMLAIYLNYQIYEKQVETIK